ncbi:MAG: hypothetical protein U0263_01560 [Polyangiaceae bacterium]
MKDKLAPVHPLSAILTIAIDCVWTIPELPMTATVVGLIVTSLASLVVAGFVVMLVQKFVDEDSWGAALTKGLVMGVLAGVPYPVAGTLAGVGLLAWAGTKALAKK